MDINYTRNLIKGKITEVIFEEMFRSTGEFTVIPIGYEHTVPELAQYQHHVHIQKVLENIRNAPDFALISQDKTKVFLVEVKYRKEINQSDILQTATELSERWNPCFLFVATPKNFYFDSTNKILISKGLIELLPGSWVRNKIQISYMSLINDFVQNCHKKTP